MIYNSETIKARKDKQKKRRELIRKITNPLMIFLLVIAVVILFQKTVLKVDMADIFGCKLFAVLTGSMEPNIKIGDAVFTHNVGKDSISIGDVITYKTASAGTSTTHRVVDIINTNGKIYYKTKGDNNNTIDSEKVEYTDIIGKVSFVIPQAGTIISNLTSTLGISIIIVCVLIMWYLSNRKEEKIAARELIRKQYNICKYMKKGV